MNRLIDFASYICMFRCGLYSLEDTPDEECFIWIRSLIGVSIVDFVNVFPIDKVYDSNGDWKDYFHSKRALDTLLSSGKTHFESLDDIIEFFFEIHIANEYVREIFISALIYMIHTAGHDVYSIMDIMTNPKPRKRYIEVPYLRLIK